MAGLRLNITSTQKFWENTPHSKCQKCRNLHSGTFGTFDTSFLARFKKNKGETDAYPKRKNQSDCYHPERGLHPNRENRIGAESISLRRWNHGVVVANI